MIKLHLPPALHRRRAPPAFQHLLAALQELRPGLPAPSISYLDQDGDRIHVTCQQDYGLFLARPGAKQLDVDERPREKWPQKKRGGARLEQIVENCVHGTLVELVGQVVRGAVEGLKNSGTLRDDQVGPQCEERLEQLRRGVEALREKLLEAVMGDC